MYVEELNDTGYNLLYLVFQSSYHFFFRALAVPT